MSTVLADTAECCLPGTPASVARARAWLEAWLRALDVKDETVETAAFVLSELASNAVKHSRSAGPTGRYHVHLLDVTDALLVSVSDAGGPRMFRPPGTAVLDDPLAESGRGLALVDRCSDRWWIHGDMNGRTVTAELALT
ncbi:ATP-binding protein [Spiractinospora alimapuensis]|uniref:ATP-binding protein n=1 Tax=Spiractinospora alimapuensis TaxID=2820884 RepID=UPI001F4857A4|nr:ATP-binding protein [Spiractinospora alimapuensis]QVQ52676.1 ATP-binding protein [Spiractinospora alimapuensis]